MSGNDYIATMDDLLQNRTTAQQQEETDRAGLQPFITPTDFSAPLSRWAASGFQSPFTIFSFQFTVPPVCSDGIKRNPYEYICFLLGQSVGAQVESFQAKIQGMKISCLLSDTTLSIRVSTLADV
jgi:hypothetical protein